MKHKQIQRSDGLRPMSRLHALALMMLGPADSPGHPLNGTKYDPLLRQRAETARRRDRLVG